MALFLLILQIKLVAQDLEPCLVLFFFPVVTAVLEIARVHKQQVKPHSYDSRQAFNSQIRFSRYKIVLGLQEQWSLILQTPQTQTLKTSS